MDTFFNDKQNSENKNSNYGGVTAREAKTIGADFSYWARYRKRLL